MKIKSAVLFIVSLLLLPFTLGSVRAESYPSLAESRYGDDSAKPITQPFVHTMTWPAYEGTAVPTLTITKSTSQLLRFDRPIIRAAISNPEICDITTIGGQEVLVNAKEAGTANLILWDKSGNIASYNLDSTLNLGKLNGVLQSIDPSATIKALSFNDTVAVYGMADTSQKLKEINEATKAFSKDAVSFVHLRETKQVLLEVRFAEINRKNNKDFKMDIEGITRLFAFRSLTGGTGSSIPESESTYTPKNGPAYNQIGLPTEETANLFSTYVSGRILVSNFLKWLELQNILKIIARPNLVAKEDEEATFLVGGEFPVPIATDDKISVDYKEFGTILKFTPEILDKELIRLKVNAEVSELDFSTTVTIGGIVLPTIIKRQNQTVAELKDNETLVIGGMLTQKISRIKRKVPYLADVPFFGTPFKAEEFERTDVELMVVITPHIVKPFRMNEEKTFYNVDKVNAAIAPYNSPYPDEQGDAVDDMMAQGETFREFDEEAIKHNRKTVEKFLKSESKSKTEPTTGPRRNLQNVKHR